MKVIYEFEEDERKRMFFEYGYDFYLALSEIEDKCRREIKYNDNSSEEVMDFAQEIRDIINESPIERIH